MGRRPRFEEVEVLTNALEVFWEQGYAGASARLLQDHIGVNPGSLYHHFESKEVLFLKVLDFYLESVVSQRVKAYLGGNNARQGVEDFFSTSFDGPSPGCLLCNSATEFGIANKEILDRLGQGNQMLVEGFFALLKRDKRFQSHNISTLRRKAEALLIAFQGYLVVGRTVTDEAIRKRYYRGILNGLFGQQL